MHLVGEHGLGTLGPVDPIGPCSDGRIALEVGLAEGDTVVMTLKRTRRTRVVVATLLAALVAMATAPSAAGASGEPKIEFAGRTWTVKTSAGLVGPGPNIFDGDNVLVDGRGRLHLAIEPREVNGQTVWTSSEVILDEPLGYGTYTFNVKSPVNDLDPNVVLGLFTWDTNPGDFNREIDIEISKFGNAADSTNAGFTVQPYDASGHQHRFEVDTSRRTRYSFDWMPEEIEFSAIRGRKRSLSDWSFSDAVNGAGAVPDAGQAQVRINLWLFRGNAPTDGQPVEVVISDFTFAPA